MIQNMTLLNGVKSDRNSTFKAGMPVALAKKGGVDVIVPFSATDINYMGVALEDYSPYDESVQTSGDNIIGVGAVGLTQVICSSPITAGDLIKPTANGYSKIATVEEGLSVGKALSNSNMAGLFVKVLLYKI